MRPIADLSAKAYSHYRSVSTDICARFGKRLRVLRKGREWTQVYMAEHVGMDRSFISDLENGKKEICIRNLEVLARAFEISVSQLMSRL
jgi:transcriptional regulator with XRE-family HTH domain